MPQIQRIIDKAAIIISFLCVHYVTQPIPSNDSVYCCSTRSHHINSRILASQKRHILCIGILDLLLLAGVSIFGHDVLNELGEVVFTEVASLIIIYAHMMNYLLRPKKAV